MSGHRPSRLRLLSTAVIGCTATTAVAYLQFGGVSRPGLTLASNVTATVPLTPTGGVPTADYTPDPNVLPTLPSSFWDSTSTPALAGLGSTPTPVPSPTP